MTSSQSSFLQDAYVPLLGITDEQNNRIHPGATEAPSDQALLEAAKIVRGIRGFVVTHHSQFGYLLLRSFKRKKGEHYQLPGGRADPEDIFKVQSRDPHEIARVAAGRELYEETGIDLRCHLTRLSPLKDLGIGEKEIRYFYLELSQADSLDAGRVEQLTIHDQPRSPLLPAARAPVTSSDLSSSRSSDIMHVSPAGLEPGPVTPILAPAACCGPITGEPFRLRLSSEHTGFCFVRSLEHAVQLVALHSDGNSSRALKKLAARLRAATKLDGHTQGNNVRRLLFPQGMAVEPTYAGMGQMENETPACLRSPGTKSPLHPEEGFLLTDESGSAMSTNFGDANCTPSVGRTDRSSDSSSKYSHGMACHGPAESGSASWSAVFLQCSWVRKCCPFSLWPATTVPLAP